MLAYGYTQNNISNLVKMYEINKMPYNKHAINFIIEQQEDLIDYFYKLDDVITIYETIKKIDKDVLVDYDLECDIWETKKMEPLLIFNFYSLDDDFENNDDYGVEPF